MRIVRDVIFDLESAGLLAAVTVSDNDRQRGYVPARDVHDLRISDVVGLVERRNLSSVDIYESSTVRQISQRLDRMMESAVDSPDNIFLEDI